MLAEHRVAIAPQIAQLLGVSRRTAQERLDRLESLRLVASDRIFEGQPRTAAITTRGLAAIERRLPTPNVNLTEYRHDIGVGWLWLAAREGAFGAISNLTSEREMRSHDMRSNRSSQPYGVGIGGFDGRGRPMRHYPDMMVTTAAGQRVAIELELTAKSARRLATIMRAYAGDGRIDGVLYVVPTDALARKVSAAAAEAGIGQIVRVQRLTREGIHGVPDHQSHHKLQARQRTRPEGDRAAAEVTER